MEVNPLRRVLTAKAKAFFGLAMLVAVVMLVIASMDSVGQAGAAQKKKKPQPKSRFGAKEVIATNGSQGFPLTGTYKSKGGTLLISASGSGSSRGFGKIGMTVSVNGAKKGTVWTYTNELNSHMAFVSATFVARNQPTGQLKIKLDNQDYPQTIIDDNDHFRVTVLEIPK
jgi:hypothetical protein